MELVKLKYVMNHGLALYFYKTLVSDISKNNISAVDCFRLCFEESLDKVTQSCEMDFMVRFFNKMIHFYKQYPVWIYQRKTTLWPLFMDAVQLSLCYIATTRRQSTFYH